MIVPFNVICLCVDDSLGYTIKRVSLYLFPHTTTVFNSNCPCVRHDSISFSYSHATANCHSGLSLRSLLHRLQDGCTLVLRYVPPNDPGIILSASTLSYSNSILQCAQLTNVPSPKCESIHSLRARRSLLFPRQSPPLRAIIITSCL